MGLILRHHVMVSLLRGWFRHIGRNVFLVGWTIALLVTFGESGAQEVSPIVGERPGYGESTLTVPPGFVQVEMGYTFFRQDPVDQQTIGELLIRLPITRRVELRFLGNSYLVQKSNRGNPVRGLEDAGLGVKFQLSRAEGSAFNIWKPQAALFLSTSIPTGNRAFRSNDPQPSVKLGVEYPLSHTLSITGFWIADWISRDNRYTADWSGSLSLGITLTPNLAGFMEMYAIFPGRSGEGTTGFVDGGLTFWVNDNLAWDAHSGIQVIGAGSGFFIGSGLIARF